jgi:hypothetical protein
LFCCFLALFRIGPAVTLAWIVAISYLVFSWRANPSWRFHEDILRFALGPPLFLSIAALFDKRKQPEEKNDGKDTE